MERQKLPVAIFVRVSLKRQDYQRQISDLQAYCRHPQQHYEVVEIIKEVISASKTKREQRPEILKLLQLVKSGQIKKVLVSEVSRLGRRPAETLDLIEQITEAGVSIYSSNFGLETLLPNGRRNPATALIFTIYAELARMESELLSERIISGQEEARRLGKDIGRPGGTTKDDQELIRTYPNQVKLLQNGISIREISKLTGAAINTIRKIKAALDRTKIV